jgi:hypothetical protein
MALPMCSLSFLMFLFVRFVDPRSIETQTNPIDRSIALLLFHQSSDHASVAVDDVSSLKSPAGVRFPPFRIVQINGYSSLCKYDEASSTLQNKQHQGPAANQGLMPASSVYSPGGLGTPKDVQSLDKY